MNMFTFLLISFLIAVVVIAVLIKILFSLHKKTLDLEASLEGVEQNLDSLKAGYKNDIKAKESLGEIDTMIKKAESDEEARDVRNRIGDIIFSGLQDYNTNHSDNTE